MPAVPEQIEQAMPTSAGGYGLRRSYRRRADVEAEIVALPPADHAGLPAALRRAVALETLVHGIRRLLTAGRMEDAQAVADVLIERASPLVARIAYSQVVVVADREDLVQNALVQMWQEVFDHGPQHEFWEVHFAHMARVACLDAAERLRRQRLHERPFKRGQTAEGDSWSEEDILPDPQAIEPALLVPEALAQLDGNVRRALFLKIQGFKERSKDQAEPTISSILGVSDRTVRNYLRAAEEILRPWLERGLLESKQVQA